jgi:hypothetical protein
MFEYFNLFWEKRAEHPLIIKAPHSMLYFYILKVANDNYWPDFIGMPTDFTMQKCGFGSYRLYKQTMDDLVQVGLIEIVKQSRNGYEATQIALNKMCKANTKANTKASDKAPSKQSTKHLHHIKTTNTIKDNKDLIKYVGDESPTQMPESKKKPREIDLSKYPPQHIESFNSFNAWLDTEAYNLRKIPEQMNIDNYLKIFKDFKTEIVKETILELHNRPEYCNPKKTHSVNLTLRNWIRRNIERQQQKTTNKNYQNEYTPRISKTEWEAKTGQKYLGQDDPNA